MRFLAAVFACSLVGCGGGGGTVCGDTTCVDGDACDLTDPDGPSCLPGGEDLDGDGLANADDHCPRQAGGKYDEDGDGIGDECDKCPIAKPPATPDPDGDDVDSPCDPDPRTPGDRIVVFNGFHEALPATWQATSGWSVQGGAAKVVPASSSDDELVTVTLPLVSQHMAVLTAYRVDEVTAGATLSQAAVAALDIRPAGTAIVTCGGTRLNATDALQLDTDVSSASDTQGFTNLFNPASLYRVAQTIDNAQAGCALIADNETGAVQAGTGGNAPTQAGLTVTGATVEFAYLLVIQRANN